MQYLGGRKIVIKRYFYGPRKKKHFSAAAALFGESSIKASSLVKAKWKEKSIAKYFNGL